MLPNSAKRSPSPTSPIKSDDIRPGLILRVISSHELGAPVGSLATVKSVETSRLGDWLGIVQYTHKRVPRQGTRLYRSHLWESHLERFEIVKELGEARVKTQRR